MTIQEFQEQANKFMQEESNVLCYKGIEYAAGDIDRLKTFKVIADFCNISSKNVCLVFLLKHIISLCKYVQEESKPTTESFEERIHDARNYLLFLAMLNREEKTCDQK